MAPPRTCECGTCKTCKNRAANHRYYRRNHEKVLELARASRSRHLEEIRARDRARGFRGDPVKQAARKAVRTALANGSLERQPCAVCRDPKSEAHHDDYGAPLDVVWLCSRHHGERHWVVMPS
jgi:hypothetical protein